MVSVLCSGHFLLTSEVRELIRWSIPTLAYTTAWQLYGKSTSQNEFYPDECMIERRYEMR